MYELAEIIEISKILGNLGISKVYKFSENSEYPTNFPNFSKFLVIYGKL